MFKSITDLLGVPALVVLVVVVIQIVRIAVSDCDLRLASKSLPKNCFNGKIVWITGASSGIGEALAVAFAHEGATLILSARRENELERVNKKIGGGAFVLPLDLIDYNTFDEKVEIVKKKFGRIDVLVNNGGVTFAGYASKTKFSVMERVTKIDYLGPIALSVAVLPTMIQQKSGKFITISSVAGKLGPPLQTAYSGAKFALLGWFQALELENYADGIRCCNICPGPVHTNLSEAALMEDGSKRGFTRKFTKKGMTPERCAELILIAGAHDLNESWISPHPPLLGCYAVQYLPTIYYFIMKKFYAPSMLREHEQEFKRR